MERPRRLPALLVNLALAAVTIVLLLAVVEGVLRLTGFSFELQPEAVQFGPGSEAEMLRVFEPDVDLLWVKRGYHDELERLRRERPPLLVLGDSCTHFGRWDEALAARVAARGESLRWGNLAVAGWSTYQGRRQLERDIAALEPAVVTLYFGWNDHWIGFGIEDATLGRLRRWFEGPWGRLRVGQLAAQATVAVGAWLDEYPERVPLEDFRANLRAMVTETRALGAVPVLFTAPTSHRPGHLPAALVPRYVRSVDELVPLHEAYVEVVREVARSLDAPLCDLHQAFKMVPESVLDASFREDGIHLTAEGDEALAAFVDACFGGQELWGMVVVEAGDATSG
ncbi:MAG: GDSL-type esterase/lipase family protein [Acidobacteriota bacterium]